MKIALFGQYYQNSTAETVQKVVAFLESKEIKIAFEAHFLATLKENEGILSFEKAEELDNDSDFLSTFSTEFETLGLST